MARYAAERRIQDSQLLTVTVATDAIVTREVYQQAIEAPIAAWLRDHDAFDRTHVIVLGPGVPLRIAGSSGRAGSVASVDSELAALYRRLTGASVAASGFADNSYFAAGPLTTPRPFDRAAYDIYMVTRLDGRTEADAQALIARGAVPPGAFVVVVDGRPIEASGAEGRWLAEVGSRIQAAQPGARVVSDATAQVVEGVSDVTGYVSWGSNDARARVPPVTFGPGAIATSFMSSDARTMAAPPEKWAPGTWDEQSAYFAGSPEALAADWLTAGLTGLGAQVSEPYLDGAFRPGTLFEAWARGYTLAESFYLAMPYVSWQAVVFGDPLARAAAPPTVSDPPAPSTAGASPFIERSATVLRQGQPRLDAEAARLMARANLSIARGASDEAQSLLEQVTVRAPQYVLAHLRLGQQYDVQKQHDLARTRYELVLRLEPANLVALNNMAYNLGVYHQQPKAALPYAERAGALGSNSPSVLDTLGWIRHLVGDSRGALDPLRRAVEAQPTMCEAWQHLAEVERVAGTPTAAGQAADRARACEASAAR